MEFVIGMEYVPGELFTREFDKRKGKKIILKCDQNNYLGADVCLRLHKEFGYIPCGYTQVNGCDIIAAWKKDGKYYRFISQTHLNGVTLEIELKEIVF